MSKVDADELVLFINNEGDLYRQQHLPIIKNLMMKHAQGKYDRTLAIKLFMYLVDNGAKKYQAQHGSPGGKWNDMFPKTVRQMAAEALRDEFEAEAKTGAYDEYIPKKYKSVSGKTIGESDEGVFDDERRAALTEVAGGDEPKMDPKIGNLATQIKNAADGLKISVKHSDDLQALADFGMILRATGAALKWFGWVDEAKRVAAIGVKMDKAAEEQGLYER